MSKVIFWVILIFAVLFALRLLNAAKARRRKEEAAANERRSSSASAAMVRCERCGVFLPRTDALPSPTGFVCGDAACAKSS